MKIPVKTIEIVRIEGPIELCDKKYLASSYGEANVILRTMSDTAPSRGGYDKCDFKVIFEDGETYEGRYDLKHWSCEQDEGPSINLKERVGGYCRFMAGLIHPSWMKDDEWESHLNHIQGFKDDYAQFLEKYDV